MGCFFVRTRDYRYANVHHPTPRIPRGVGCARSVSHGQGGLECLSSRGVQPQNNMPGSRVFISTTNVAGSSPPRRDDVIDRDRIFPTPWGIAADSKLLAVLCLLFLSPPRRKHRTYISQTPSPIISRRTATMSMLRSELNFLLSPCHDGSKANFVSPSIAFSADGGAGVDGGARLPEPRLPPSLYE